MKFTDELHKEVEGIWEQYHNHPFVKSIGDGTLDIKKFQYFMVQDYLYLFEYAKVFAIGVVKSTDAEYMKNFAKDVDGILNGEMKIHQKYMEKLGISEKEVLDATPAPANISYTNYMLSQGAIGGVEEIIATILACSWSYAEIGLRLANEKSLSHEFFGEWIAGYSGEDFQKTNIHLIDRMDELAKNLPEKRKENLKKIFVNCSLYELGFWDMAWKMA